MEIRSLAKINKKGQVFDLVIGSVISLLVFLAVVIGVLLAMGALGNSITLGTNEGRLAVNATIDNTSQGITKFAQNIPTAFIVFGVIFILAIVGVLISVVLRFRSAGGGAAGL